MVIRISFWLVPAGSFKAIFEDWITRLGAPFGAPLFEPHVTVFSGSYREEDIADILQDAASSAPEIHLAIQGIGHSPVFTKAVFVELASSADLVALSERLKQRQEIKSAYELCPHISLLYAHLDSSTRQELARTVSIDGGKVAFDTLRAVATCGQTNSNFDVERWKTIGSVRLAAMGRGPLNIRSGK
jgi:putative hydrolase of the HAD superfamily